MGQEGSIIITKYPSNDNPIRNFPRNLRPDTKTKRIFKFCNHPDEIVIGSEGK